MGEVVEVSGLSSEHFERTDLASTPQRPAVVSIRDFYTESLLDIAARQSHDLITEDSSKVSDMVGIIAAASFFSDGALPANYPKLYRVANEYATHAAQDSESIDALETVYEKLGGWTNEDLPRHDAVHMIETLGKELGRSAGYFTRDEFVAVRRRILAMALGFIPEPTNDPTSS